jgi:hypothetical protein
MSNVVDVGGFGFVSGVVVVDVDQRIIKREFIVIASIDRKRRRLRCLNDSEAPAAAAAAPTTAAAAAGTWRKV